MKLFFFVVFSNHFLNQIISEAVCPSCLKTAKKVPIFKKEDKTLPCNYILIFSISVIGKIFEKLLSKPIISFFNKFDVLSNKPFGFRNKRSLIDAIVQTLEVLIESNNTDILTYCTISDLSKAFDTIDHNTLIYKCHLYGLRGFPPNLSKSYLSNRNRSVFQSNNCSTTEKLHCGVIQGSVLGPLLFVIYINDLPNIPQHSEWFLYADDSYFFGTLNETEALKTELE